MSSAVVSTTAALGRPFVFDAKVDAEACAPVSAHRGERAEVQESSIARLCQSVIKNQQSRIPPAGVTRASRLSLRPAPEMVSSGISAIDTLAGGLPRGCLTEICGPASSGRTTLLLAALAAATRRGEFCVVVDASDALDPHSAAAAGVELERLLWVRCGEASPQSHRGPEKHENQKEGCPISGASSTRKVGTSSQVAFPFDRAGREKNEGKETGWRENGARQSEHRVEQVLRATDLLLESGGFGLIVLDLGDLAPHTARRIPLTTWFRFRRAVEYTSTILLAIEQHPIAGSCSSLLLKLGAADEPAAERRKIAAHGAGPRSLAGNEEAREGRKKICLNRQNTFDFPYPTHTQLLTGLEITAELIRSRLDRKPARSTAAFASKTAWAG
jgi:recombination protein RecA